MHEIGLGRQEEVIQKFPQVDQYRAYIDDTGVYLSVAALLPESPDETRHQNQPVSG